MSTINEDNFDYQAYMRNNPPDPTKINRGLEARRQRLAAAMKRRTIRIEEDILNQFQEIVPPGQGAEQAINQALREWLAAKDLKEMIRAELQDAVHQAFIQVGVDLLPRKPERSLAIEEG